MPGKPTGEAANLRPMRGQAVEVAALAVVVGLYCVESEPARLALARLERDLDAITTPRGGIDHTHPDGAAELPEGVGEALESLGYTE